jgi:hypothetical protein
VAEVNESEVFVQREAFRIKIFMVYIEGLELYRVTEDEDFFDGAF